MAGLWIKRFGMALLAAGIVAAFYLAMKERPAGVDVARASRAPMQVTLVQEGKTRVKDIYTISAPIAGHLARTVLDAGDPVKANSTVVAAIRPLDPPLIDTRTYEELLAGRDVAAAAVTIANAEEARAKTALETARDNLERTLRLARSGIVSESSLLKFTADVEALSAALDGARSTVELRKAELKSAEARLRQPGTAAPPVPTQCCVNLTAPVDGVVLEVFARSEQPLAPGARIADIGDPRRIEIVADVNSSDAVAIRAGTAARIVDWGGEPLKAAVRRVDPGAFTKISALGIEEQRVNVILDLEKGDDRLGNGFRVFAEMILWNSPSCLQVPISALFRQGDRWSLFTVQDGRAQSRIVGIDHMNGQTAEIVSGLSEGDTVILHPSDTIVEGRLVEPRE